MIYLFLYRNIAFTLSVSTSETECVKSTHYNIPNRNKTIIVLFMLQAANNIKLFFVKALTS